MENARRAVGEEERGARGAEDWGGSPYPIDLTIIGLPGNPALQGGTEDPQLWAVCLASHGERMSEVGSNPRFSFWLPQDGNHCFRFPSLLPELMLSFLRYKTIYGSPLPTGLNPNASDVHLVLSPTSKLYLLCPGAFCLLFPLLGNPVPPFPPPRGALSAKPCSSLKMESIPIWARR